jgi:hypothetical protein
VFDGIEVDVIDVALEVCVVANCVLPEPTLPERRFSIVVARDGRAHFRDGARETTLD